MHTQEQELAHRQQVSERLSPLGRKFFNFIEFDPNEELVEEIRKHSIGFILILLSGGLVAIGSLLLVLLLGASDLDGFFGSSGLNGIKSSLLGVSLILFVIALAGTLIGLFLYRSNVIFVTSEKIAQILYTGIFNRKISQLSIGDVQDVTVTQKGILAHLFNYGTLVVETAGEQQNYTFTYVPDPYATSKAIVGAHERNLTQYGN